MATTINQHNMGIDGTASGRDTGSFGKELKKFAGTALITAATAGLGFMLCISFLMGVMALSAWIMG